MPKKPQWYYKQSAVIPYRIKNHHIEILMITSRSGKHWIVPKGIIEPNLLPAESAAKEALEEAGVEGVIHSTAAGSYKYQKWGDVCKVQVFLMQVTKTHNRWAEKEMRTRRWMSVEKACAHVREKKLRKLIAEMPEFPDIRSLLDNKYPEFQKGKFVISSDPERLDFDVIHGYLTRAYWSEGISKEIVIKAAMNSLSFGVYKGASQVGFARVITDFTSFAYLADVFILEKWQGRGRGKWLIETITNYPELQSIRRWMLATKDAHGLYAKYGFLPIKNPESLMEFYKT